MVLHGDEIGAFFTLSPEPEDDYDNITDGKWHYPGAYCTLHRAAVAAAYRGSGMADRVMEFVDAESEKLGFRAVRTDTHRRNTAMGDDSGTGVAFTRDPATGEKKLYGEFLMNAQGEDVVAGIRTPQTIDQLKDTNKEAYEEFVKISTALENHYKDMQDMEFTIERGKLYMLQTRNGKRTPQAGIKIAVALVKEGLCTKEEALLKIEPRSLDALLHPGFDKKALAAAKPVASGLPASPGAACGAVYFTAEDAAAHGLISSGWCSTSSSCLADFGTWRENPLRKHLRAGSNPLPPSLKRPRTPGRKLRG